MEKSYRIPAEDLVSKIPCGLCCAIFIESEFFTAPSLSGQHQTEGLNKRSCDLLWAARNDVLFIHFLIFVKIVFQKTFGPKHDRDNKDPLTDRKSVV